ncbi:MULTISPECIES: cell division protein FtsL [Marinobacter]|jgi:cell division protein FtsL|uniref:Cell division protein FtsL n=1 Tax=Marinobacter segnicrescens TaxID=430453 RepID=A0A1I0G2L6_9GAMM|nr:MULTISPECIES: cell division protein FtsL [Marinobacter]UZD66823.1 cell division protein FtsL [Marinobacter sp. AN1]SET64921.1 cell division protein FtsL [Marinobacter segnicrescens]
MSAVTLEKPAKAPVLTREAVRGRVSDALKLSARIFRTLAEPKVVVTLGLAVFLIGSAIGVAVSAHQNRELYNALSELQVERDAYQRQWSQLLLEQSALSAHGRIERKAVDEFDMVVPGREHIVLVPSATTDRIASVAK